MVLFFHYQLNKPTELILFIFVKNTLMAIDTIYKTAQAEINKEQLGYLKPMDFNLYARKGVRKIYDGLLVELKSSVRKMNWMLDGKDFADISEHYQQLLEYFSTVSPVPKTTNYVLPEDLEFVEDIFTTTGIRIEKTHYSDYMDLQNNIYAKPNTCIPICAKVGNSLLVSPTQTSVNLHYLRKPKTANWTFVDYNGKPMFDPTANDYQDIDLPESFHGKLIDLIIEMASISLRMPEVTQAINQEQAQNFQTENNQ